MATPSQLLAVAAAEIGYDRYKDPERGTKYGRWYEAVIDKRSDNYDYGASGVPFCAMGASWTQAQVGVSCVGFPSAYCPSIVAAARSKGVLRAAETAKPADMVLFDWEGDGTSDHVGICEINKGSYLQTIEFNTNNGKVCRRTRKLSTIIGVITPNFDGATSAPTPPNVIKEQAAQAVKPTSVIAEDGLWGCNTTRAAQRAMGTVVDGIVSQQHAAYKAQNPGLLSSSWQFVASPRGGSDMVGAMQGKIGAKRDKFAGPETFRRLQAYLGTEQDGCISRPSTAVRAMQKRLNAGTCFC